MIQTLAILIAISWFVTHAEPLQNAIDNTAIMLRRWYATIFLQSWYHRFSAFILDALYIILGCWMCLTLWMTFAYTGDFGYACLASMIVSFIPDDRK